MNLSLGVRVIHLLILCTLFSICFVVTPTFIFSQLEPSWDVLDAFYYVFISLTTIGLGDYIPGDGNQQQVPELLDLYKASVAGDIQFQKMNVIPLLNKPYIGGVTLREQKLT